MKMSLKSKFTIKIIIITNSFLYMRKARAFKLNLQKTDWIGEFIFL